MPPRCPHDTKKATQTPCRGQTSKVVLQSPVGLPLWRTSSGDSGQGVPESIPYKNSSTERLLLEQHIQSKAEGGKPGTILRG